MKQANLQWINREFEKWLETERGRKIVPSGKVRTGPEHLAKLFAAHCLEALNSENDAMESLVTTPPSLCSHDELKWGRKKETIGGKEITVCGRCREEIEQPEAPKGE